MIDVKQRSWKLHLISYYLSIFLYTIVFKVVKEKMDEGEDIANTKKHLNRI